MQRHPRLVLPALGLVLLACSVAPAAEARSCSRNRAVRQALDLAREGRHADALAKVDDFRDFHCFLRYLPEEADPPTLLALGETLLDSAGTASSDTAALQHLEAAEWLFRDVAAKRPAEVRASRGLTKSLWTQLGRFDRWYLNGELAVELKKLSSEAGEEAEWARERRSELLAMGRERRPARQGGDEEQRASGGVRPPVRLSGRRASPQYTRRARLVGVEGTVVLQGFIGVDGRLSDLRVMRGLPMGLSAAAIEAVREWRFQPATSNGVPIRSAYNVSLRFGLDS